VVIVVATSAVLAALGCPVCALNDSTRGDGQWWAVLAALLVPFVVVVAVGAVIRRVLRAEDPAP